MKRRVHSWNLEPNHRQKPSPNEWFLASAISRKELAFRKPCLSKRQDGKKLAYSESGVGTNVEESGVGTNVEESGVGTNVEKSLVTWEITAADDMTGSGVP